MLQRSNQTINNLWQLAAADIQRFGCLFDQLLTLHIVVQVKVMAERICGLTGNDQFQCYLQPVKAGQLNASQNSYMQFTLQVQQ